MSKELEAYTLGYLDGKNQYLNNINKNKGIYENPYNSFDEEYENTLYAIGYYNGYVNTKDQFLSGKNYSFLKKVTLEEEIVVAYKNSARVKQLLK